MARRRLLFSILAFLFLVAARQRAVHHPSLLPAHPAYDAFSFSDPTSVTVTHVSLDLAVDFETRTLSGTATLTIGNAGSAGSLVLDTHDLDIESVTLDGTAAQWTVGAGNEYGQPLTIPITPLTRTVTIAYTTSPGAPGLYWNTAAQSYGRREPYLYSLNEPVDARSWIPIQDTPSARMTWEATLHVPPHLLALMSAENNPTALRTDGLYHFRMTKAVPSYLIALAVGRLEYHPFDTRTGVYAEPELMEDAAWELQYLPQMVAAAETIAGPLPFIRHDVLLMPPTFVVGGMEHPMLNFINPFSVVSGNHPPQPDAKNLIAHELAHSWSGDLVTTANWNDVWLNEGITSYLALRILEEMGAGDRAELSYFLDRRSFASWASQPGNDFTSRLHRDVVTPMDGFGFAGYTKGELFIRTLEDRLGRTTLDAFLRRWFDRFAFRWVDDVSFLVTLNEFVPAGSDLRLLEWIYGSGLPSSVTAATSSSIYDRALARADAFRTGTPMSALAPETWSDTDIEQFLAVVPTNALRSRLSEIDTALGLSVRTTPPLNFLIQSTAVGYMPAMPAVERVLLRGGPNGWITQLYNALRWTPTNRTFAQDVFRRARDRYHPDVAAYVAQILGMGTSVVVPPALRDAA